MGDKVNYAQGVPSNVACIALKYGSFAKIKCKIIVNNGHFVKYLTGIDLITHKLDIRMPID